MRKTLKWIGRILLGVVGLVVVAVSVVLIAIHTDWGREQIRKRLEASLNSTFEGGAKIGRIDGSAFTDLLVSDVVINGPDLKPAISIKKLRVHIALWPLLSHHVNLDKLIADDVDIELKREATGDLEIKHLTKPGPKSQFAWSLSFARVEIHRGHLMFDTGNELIDVDNLQVDAHANVPHNATTELAAMLTGTWRQKGTFVSVAGVFATGPDGSSIPSALVQVGRVQIAAAAVKIPKSDSEPFNGTISVVAPADQVQALVPDVELPADVTLAVEATGDGPWTRLAINGTVGGSPVRGFARGDLKAKIGIGIIVGDDLDLGKLSSGKVTGIGGAFVAFDVAPGAPHKFPTAHAMVTTWGAFAGTPRSDSVIALDTEGDRIRALVGARSVNGFHGTVAAEIHRNGTAYVLDRGVVIAATRDAATATGGRSPVHGSLVADVSASGELSPATNLAISGHVEGKHLSMNDISAATLHFQIAATNLPKHPVGSARVEVTQLVREDLEITRLTLAAGNRPDGKLQVSLRSQPKQAPTRVDVDALIAMGDTTIVDLQRHIVRATGGNLWEGNTGHLVITANKIELTDFKSATRGGSLALDGSYVRAGRGAGDLDAKASGGMELSDLSYNWRGRVDANVDLQRRAGKLSGVVATKVRNLSTDESLITLDIDGKVDARGGKVTADIDASSARIGTAKIALDVAAPEDITKVADWRKLGRDSIRTADLKLHDIDVGAIADFADIQQRVRGKIDGEIQITPTTLGGLIQMRGLYTEQLKDGGSIDAELRVAQNPKDDDEIMTTLTGTMETIGRMQVEARFYTPERLFDPAAWNKLGNDAFHGGSVRTDQIAFDPGTMEKFGIFTNMRGKVVLQANLERGLRDGSLTVDIRDLRGDKLAEPVAIHADAEIDRKDARGVVFVRTNDGKITLLRVTTKTPITLDLLRTNPKAARDMALQATIALPQVPAKQFLNTLGVGQVTAGVLDGRIEVAGTIGRPTATIALVATNVTVPPGAGGKIVQVMKELKIDGNWDGAAGKLVIAGIESNGGTINLTAAAQLDALKDATASLQAHQLDLAPVVAFLPGPAGGLGGKVDANLTMHGFDPKTAEIAGTLGVSEGRLPIAPAVGTLFHGDLQAKVEDHKLKIRLKGKLGKGDVSLVGTAPLDGTGGEAELDLNNVQLIGTTEPIITAKVTATIGRQDQTWHAKIDINQAHVKVPDRQGTKLAPAGAPNDLIYGGQARIVKDPTQVEGTGADTHRKNQDPEPAAIADIEVHRAYIESKEIRGVVNGKVQATLGTELTLTGDIGLERGDLDLFDRRYNVERAMLHYDGGDDPILDVRITHDFPDVTTITEVHGRMSKPELVMSSNPGIYSQAELLGFLLGGEPGGDPRNAPSARDKVAGAGASIIANQIGGYVKKSLPVDVDVLRYESASATSSAAVMVGSWVTHSLFLAYRQHLAPRPDENNGEADIEYWFKRRYMLEVVAGDRGKEGLDLLWRRRW